jgi:hypothetical protein
MTRLFACALLASAACSHALRESPDRPPPTSSAEDARSVAAVQEEKAVELDHTLSSLTLGEMAPDCPRGCELAGQICELTDRICLLSSRHEGEADLATRCTAARQRCQRARERVAAVCSCSTR